MKHRDDPYADINEQINAPSGILRNLGLEHFSNKKYNNTPNNITTFATIIII
jgi:hypothetical protein